MMSAQTGYQDAGTLTLRPAREVMDPERLGQLHPYRLSFMRSLIRKIGAEKWQIERVSSVWDAHGHGHAIYEIRTPSQIFSFVAFSKAIDPVNRSDRVIAEDWDMTGTLCAGTVDAQRLEGFRANVPLQEKGRVDATCLVLSRANKSQRNFSYVAQCLADGQQPSVDALAKVGYLYRTTAVYGSGKFGLADWRKIQSQYSEFNRPFMAEMLTCYLIRQFSLDQVEHIAQQRSADKAVQLDPALKRYIGIGNATGLGMAPYLINHPLLINRWVEAREIALARVLEEGVFSAEKLEQFFAIARQAIQHLSEIESDNAEQNERNAQSRSEFATLIKQMKQSDAPIGSWRDLWAQAGANAGSEVQDIVGSIIIELYPELTDDLEEQLCEAEDYRLDPTQALSALKMDIEAQYDWALDYDFDRETARSIFWYRSVEKMEPRLGVRGTVPGQRRELMMGVAYAVQQCHAALSSFHGDHPDAVVAEFVLAHPEHRRILRRIQTMARTRYGDIRANLLDADVLPTNLLRCKLSFFGVSKFDPRSRLWVRNTMFQGAPLPEELANDDCDSWYFPVKPALG